MKLLAYTMTALIGLFFSLPTVAQSLMAGRWTTKADMTVNNMPIPTMDDENCLTEKDAKDAKRYVERQLKANGCKLTSWFANEKPPSRDVQDLMSLVVGVECNTDVAKGKGTLKGTMRKTEYSIAGLVRGEHDVFGEVDFDIKYSGKYAGACTTKASSGPKK